MHPCWIKVFVSDELLKAQKHGYLLYNLQCGYTPHENDLALSLCPSDKYASCCRGPTGWHRLPEASVKIRYTWLPWYPELQLQAAQSFIRTGLNLSRENNHDHTSWAPQMRCESQSKDTLDHICTHVKCKHLAIRSPQNRYYCTKKIFELFLGSL